MNNLFLELGLDDGTVAPTDLSTVPSYLLAADNHNLGNSGGSWLDPETWKEKFDSAGKMISAGILSGANSFYNSGVTIGNWLGESGEQRDTQDFIAGIDSDLGVYYAKNRSAADLVGFVAGSIIPGTAGVKILNAGQKALSVASKTGLFGENLGRAIGLVVPQTERYIALAAKDITQSAATFNTLNSNALKALRSGVYQNTLEGIAFETFVQATMFQSPILQNQDSWDIVKNVAIGGAVGGVIGGAFTGASSLGKIKRIVAAEESALKPFTSRATIQEGLSPAEKIILMAEDRDFGALPLPGSENFEAAQRLYADRVRRIDNDTRSQFHNIVRGEDTELGNMIADASHGLGHTAVLNNMLYVEEAARLGKLTRVEKDINELVKAGKPVPPEYQLSYLRLHGEGAGEVLDTMPLVRNLADRAKNADGVLDQVREYKFREGQNWSALDLSGEAAHYEAEARYIWADSVLKELKPGTAVNQYDIPVLERALRENILDIKLVDNAGGILKSNFGSAQELQAHIIAAKTEAANELLIKLVLDGKVPVESGTQVIAKITNTKLARLEGTAVGSESDDFFAWQAANRAYAADLARKGLVPANKTADTRFLPSIAKLSKRIQNMDDLDGNVIDGMAWIKSKQQLLKQSVNNVVAKATGALYESIPDIPDSLLLNANRYGAGAGVASFANGTYGSLESTVQLLGSVTKRLGIQFRQATADVLEGPLATLGRKQEAIIEAAAIDQKVTRSAKQWVRHSDDTGEYLVTKDAKNILDNPQGESSLDNIAEEELIELVNPETIAYINSSIERSGFRTSTYRELRAAQGLQDVKDSSVYRPVRPSPTDYPFFAFVKDPRVTGQGHTTMIFANTEQKLKELIEKVPKEYETITKGQAEEFYAARNEYEYSRTLHESYIDTNLKNRGIQSEFFTITDPKTYVNRALQQHIREDDVLAKELIRGKNQAAFDWLEDQSKQYSQLESSRFGGSVARVEKSGKNPYLDYIKTALDISKVSEHPLLYGFNKFLDEGVSRAVGRVRDLWQGDRSTESLEAINSALDKFGMNTGWRDSATDLLVNHSAPKGALTKFIRGANAVLARLTLGLDPLNALNNAIGANILRTTELKQLTRAIGAGDAEIAGQLAEIGKIKLPGTGDQILSPPKLLASSIRRYFQDMMGSQTLLKEYQAAGFVQDITTQFKSILDDFTLKGTESVSLLQSRLQAAIKKADDLTEAGQKYTGNKLAEEFNRFISADVMRQITDIAVNKGILTKAEQHAYINTFVNRVEGNVIASQRPLMFQGPIGQAIGLFQSYQFNLMQQLFRYVSEGTKKDAAMLLGLQGTFYGLQGLPAFQFINQHIVGTLSGNTNHVDLYDSTYGVAGRDVGNFVLYGLPSNLLQANLYSRGDINPRQVTVIPTTLPDIPFIGAFGKFLLNMTETVGKIGQGAPVWESMLQGLEHNGLSRPMAGLAQVLQATGPGGQPYSTTSKGSILFSNDLLAWASAVRLAGGRPLDEAIVNDSIFRIHGYQQYDRAKKMALAESVKASVIQGNVPSGDAISSFASTYAAAGGKQAQFNKFMLEQIKSANVPEAQKIMSQLQNPFSQKVQLLMGYSGE